MKKQITSLFLLCVTFLNLPAVQAQNPPRSDARIKTNLAQVRFLVNTPASQAGLKKITIASWGNQGTAPVLNQPVVRGLDSLAALPLTNGAAVNGKVCLLFRGGGITFAQKAQYAVSAGATALIIVNNVPGDPAGMSNTGTATYTIPIVMVSDVDGIAMNNALISSIPVNVSIGIWNLGKTHDLALLTGYVAAPHAMNIPLSQAVAGASALPYKNFVGGAIFNYGTSTENAVTVSDSVIWTPTGGSASLVHADAYTIPSIAPSDSVRFGFGNATSAYFLPTPASTGVYSYKHSIAYSATDELPQDNVATDKQYITDSIFCKGNYDFVRNQPVVNLGIQPSQITTPYSMGPLYYMSRGRYAAKKLQFSISKNSVTTLAGEETFGLLYKWVDGSAAQPLDSFVEGAELKLIGIVYKSFTTADTSGSMLTLSLKDPNTPAKTIVLDSNSWYWTGVQATNTCFVGVDKSISYFTRAYAQSQLFNYQELPELLVLDNYTGLTGSAAGVAAFPFGNSPGNIDSTFYDRFYDIPAVAFHISKNPIGTAVGKEPSTTIGTIKAYPSPANSFITIDIKLNKSYISVKYRLLDIVGRVVYKVDKDNTQNDHFTIPTESINSGIYHLVVITNDGLNTERVVIQH